MKRLALALVCAVLVLAPFLVGFAGSVAAPPDAGGSSAPTSLPSLPDTGAPADLAGLLDPVPLVVTDLPDGASRDAARRFLAAGVLDADEVRAAFEEAWAALVVPADSRDVVTRVGRALVHAPQTGALPDGVDEALTAIAGTADNADRVNNAAVMLLALGALNDAELALPPDDSTLPPPFYGPALEDEARLLLEEADARFEPSRAVLVNLAFARSVTDLAAGMTTGIAAAQDALALDDGDTTARMLLASLQAREPQNPEGWRAALETVEPLTEEEATRALGIAARGDVLLSAASLRETDAPGTARVLARRAVAEYDRALALAGDAELFAGRARAARLAGDLAAARDAVAIATDLAPDSPSLHLTRATLDEAAGDTAAQADAAATALDLGIEGWNPPVSEARLVATVNARGGGIAAPGDLGYLGASIGSARTPLGLVREPQGGVLLPAVDVVPALLDPYTDDWRRGALPADAALDLYAVAVTGEDAPEIGAAADRWANAPSTAPLLAADLASPRWERLVEAVWGAQIAALHDVPEGLEPAGVDPTRAATQAEAALRRTGRFDAAGALCRDLVDARPDVFDVADTWRCVGDAALLREDAGAAVEAYTTALERDPQGVTVVLRRGAALLAAGRRDEGRRALEGVAVGGSESVPAALLRLADDALDAGDPAVALSYLDLAGAAAGRASAAPDDRRGQAALRAVTATIANNRGVLLLRLAQPGPGEAPVCAQDGARCADAEAALEVARAISPLDPDVLVNLGWVHRARGELTEARRSLAAATDADPSLYPAANDLGVLAARDGDGQAAEDAFTAALAAEGDYALAWWNLGVLKLRRGPLHVADAQADLARATRLDPALAGSGYDFRTDEALYRRTFTGVEEVETDWPVARTYGLGAALLGGAGLLGALARLLRGAFGGLPTLLSGLVPSVSESRVGAWRERLPGRGLGDDLPEGVRRTTPWWVAGLALVLVTAVMTWRQETAAFAGVLTATLLATAAALAVHEGAHAVAARRESSRLVPAQWTGGVALAVVLLPFQASTGPYFAERFPGVADERVWRVHLAGPVANLAFAAVAYGAFLLRPAPLLLLVSQVSLAVCAYSLLPNLPLDGPAVQQRSPLLAASLGLVVTAAGTAFTLGL